jgi:hypothetical protein
MDIEPVPDLEIARYALRSFGWRVEPVTPKFKAWIDGLPPPPLLAPDKPGDPAYPIPGRGVPLGTRRWTEEYAPPPGLEHIGWWDDGSVRLWRAPTYSRSGDWEDGTCKAVCHAWHPRDVGGHKAPHEGCSCGIYGSLSYADLIHQFREYVKHIVVVIAAEGKTIIGDRGLRTAFARVVAYWVAPDQMYREVAAAQFKDAKDFGDPLGMVEAYGLELLPPAEEEQPNYTTTEWWTRSAHKKLS